MTTTAPLFVDLDDTFILGDSLYEGAASLVREQPSRLLAGALALRKGIAPMKAALADSETKPHQYAVNEPLLAFLEAEKAKGRPIILATAADEKIARRVADAYPVFTDVIASNGVENLKGERKLGAIQAWLATHGHGPDFGYIGDSSADGPLWDAALERRVVAISEEAAISVRGKNDIDGVFERPAPSAKTYLKAMRVQQWAKNTLIFAPLILAHEWFAVDKIVAALIAFFAFSLTASATYIWNDVMDLSADRAHPRKKKRPFASGVLPVRDGVVFSAALLTVALGAVVIFLPLIVVAHIIGYIALTLSYSLVLKRKLLLDVIVLASLYGYRMNLGAVTTGVELSDWLVAFSFLFFLGLALVKRCAELVEAIDVNKKEIKARGYRPGDLSPLQVLGIASGMMAIVVFVIYIGDEATAALYREPRYLWIIGVILFYWTARLWVLVYRRHMNDDPIAFAIKDRHSLVCGALCGAALLLAI